MCFHILEAENKRKDTFKAVADECMDRTNIKLPINCRLQINLGLSGDSNWVGQEKYNKTYKTQMSVVTPHVCRHTFCSNMAKSGMPHRYLQCKAPILKVKFCHSK